MPAPRFVLEEPTTSAGEEQQFRRWYAGWAQRLNLNSNPDDPRHFYDYRSAFRAGARPDASGHWPSEFKREGHPNRFVLEEPPRARFVLEESPSLSEQVRATPGHLTSEFRIGEPGLGAMAARALPLSPGLQRAAGAFVDYPLSVLNVPFRSAGILARDISAYGGAGIARLGQKVGLNLGPTDPREVAQLPLVRGIETAAEIGSSLAVPYAAARAAARPRLSVPPGTVLEAPPPSPARTVTRRAEPDLQAPTPASVTATPAGVVQPATAQKAHRTVAESAADTFLQQRGLRDPKRLISDQITDLLTTDQLHIKDLEQLLGQNNLTVREFAEGVFRPSVRRAAQTLGILGRVERQILAIERASPAEATRLRELARGLDEYAKARGMWERLGDVWRGSLVGQSATAARNLATTVGRAGLDVFEAGWDQAVGVVTGTQPKSSPMEGVQTLLNMLWRPRAAARNVEAVLRQLPSEHDRMFGTFASELSAQAGPGTKVLGAGEKVVHWLNVFNRGQEFLSRRAIFQAHLDQRLRGRGLSLDDAIHNNRLDDIPAEDIRGAIDKALDITFGTRTKFANAFSQMLDTLPGPLRLIPQTVLPFPNFLAQTMRFFAEYSPAGFLKLLSPAERAAIAAGEVRSVSRALVGTGLLGAAYELRKSEHAGERWYEIRLPDGRTIDTRPYNPFASYMFAADLIVRHQDGRLALSPADLQDVLQATLTANIRGGTSLDFVNNIIGWARGETGGARRAQRYAGEFVAGFLNPLRTLTDAMAEFGAFPKDLRETRTEPFAGPIKARIPGLAESLPAAVSPTRTGPITREAPLLRQATGITLTQAKNPAEAEFDRLGITRSQVLPSTGLPELDRARAEAMGPLVERALGGVVQNPRYQAYDDARKMLVVNEVLRTIRAAVGARVRAQRPDLWTRYRMERLPRAVQEILREEGIGR